MTRFVKIVTALVAVSTVPTQDAQALQITMGAKKEDDTEKGENDALFMLASAAKGVPMSYLKDVLSVMKLAPNVAQEARNFIGEVGCYTAGQEATVPCIGGCFSGSYVGYQLKKALRDAAYEVGKYITLVSLAKFVCGWENGDVNRTRERFAGVNAKELEKGQGDKKYSVFAVCNGVHGSSMKEGDVVLAFGETRDDMKKVDKGTKLADVNDAKNKFFEVEGSINSVVHGALDVNGDGKLDRNDALALMAKVFEKYTGVEPASRDDPAVKKAIDNFQKCGFAMGAVGGCCVGFFCCSCGNK